MRDINYLIDASSTGDNTVIPAIEGSSIPVVSLLLRFSGTGNAEFKYPGQTLIPAGFIDGDAMLILDAQPDGRAWFTCPEGQSLIINLSAGMSVKGRIRVQI